MSLLIKALQKAEKSKEGAVATEMAPTESAELELAPHHDDIDTDFSLAEESGFSEPIPPLTPPPAAKSTAAAPERSIERDAAANLFRARTEAVSEPGGRRAFWLGLGGLALLLLAGIGFYFYLGGLQQPELVAVRPAPALPIATTATAASPALPAAPVAAPEAPPVEPAAAPASPSADAAKPASTKPTEPAEPVVETKAVTTKPPTAKPSHKKPDAEESAVKVTRNRNSEPTINATAMAAYQAYTAGDDAAASRLYRQLLQTEPRNVDALLGLAATAARQENTDEAARQYMRVLELEPRNSVAQAGIIALVGQADPVAAESRLKTLLAQQPDAAYLHAALGGVYAEQNQWPSAQQAYFQAFRLDPASAEYAFNLAVSLDQMSKPDLALDYYQRSRELLPKQGGAVDRSGLDTRISQLRSALGK